MKKTIIAVAILLALSTGAFAQNHKDSTKTHKMTSHVKYTCTMHPEVVMSKPGKCPKCGMKLVAMKPKKNAKATSKM